MKKSKGIIELLIFSIEFIIAILFAYLTYRFFIIKSYEGFWHRGLLLILIPITIILIAIIIYNCIRNKSKIEKIFLGFIIPIGILYLVFIEPTYVPDENAHLWKSYEVSQGVLITPMNKDGAENTEVPKIYKETNIIHANYKKLDELLTNKTDYKDTEKLISPAQNYNFIFYIFSGIGLAIGKFFGMNGFFIIYLARLFNYIAFLIFAYFSIKKIPFGKLVMSMYLFMPMLVHQVVSISADCLVNAILLFYISYNLYLLFNKKRIKTHQIVLYIIMSILVGIAKIVYLPLVGMSLLFISKKNIDKKQKWTMIIASILLAVLITGGWYIYSSQYISNQEYITNNNVNSMEQMKKVLTNPFHGVKVINSTLIERGEFYLYTMIGSNLGWLDIEIPIIKIIAFIILIVLSIFFERNKESLSGKQRLWLICITLITIFIILIALYIGWTSVESEIVAGVQGRYFLPIMILPLLCCSMKENYVKIKNIHIYMMLTASLLNLSVIYNIYNFFV